ncbi:Putative DNA primase/helicase (fragment) [Burkholderiales bacterium 8X]
MSAIPKQALDTLRDSIDAACSVSDPWAEVQSLIARVDAQEYPTDALPLVVRNAVQEVSGFVKAPMPLIAVSALAALSLAVQAHHDVERAVRLDGPCGLFLLAIADSGERKSTCDGFFTKSIREYEAAEQEAAKPLIQEFETDHEIWDAQRSGLKERIKSLAKEGKPSTAQERELHDHDKAEPRAPRVPRLIYGDATPEALQHSLAKRWPSGGVVSSEAGSVFGSHGMGKESVMRNLAALNQLWDGATLPVERRSSESYVVRGARLTMALQVQEATLRSFFDSTKGLARGTGFLARFLVAWPLSTQGMRPFTEAPTNWPALAAFNERMSVILNRDVPIDEEGALSPAMLTLSPEAKAAWVSFHDQIEELLPTGGELYDVRDVASKIADNAARLAALFHVFEGHAGPIGIDSMEAGARIAVWHLNEARRFLGELAMPAELANPLRLEAWLLDYCRREHTDKVPTRSVQQFGPSGLRDRASMLQAVQELQELGRLRTVMDGRKRLLQINPEVLGGAV